MRHALLGIVGCALVLAISAETAQAANETAKYKATRDITLDAATGKPRRPNDAELAKLVADLKSMTRRPALPASSSTLASGARVASLDDGFAGVILARPKSDGTYETRCVFTFEEAVEFLGLVADDSQ